MNLSDDEVEKLSKVIDVGFADILDKFPDVTFDQFIIMVVVRLGKMCEYVDEMNGTNSGIEILNLAFQNFIEVFDNRKINKVSSNNTLH